MLVGSTSRQRMPCGHQDKGSVSMRTYRGAASRQAPLYQCSAGVMMIRHGAREADWLCVETVGQSPDRAGGWTRAIHTSAMHIPAWTYRYHPDDSDLLAVNAYTINLIGSKSAMYSAMCRKQPAHRSVYCSAFSGHSDSDPTIPLAGTPQRVYLLRHLRSHQPCWSGMRTKAEGTDNCSTR